MSKKGKDRRERYQERQAKEGVKVFNWILGALAIGALAFIIYSRHKVNQGKTADEWT